MVVLRWHGDEPLLRPPYDCDPYDDVSTSGLWSFSSFDPKRDDNQGQPIHLRFMNESVLLTSSLESDGIEHWTLSVGVKS